MASPIYELSYLYKDSSCWSQLPNNSRTENGPQIVLKSQMVFQIKMIKEHCLRATDQPHK